VHYARPEFITDTLEIIAVRKKGVDQGAARVSRRRVNDESWLLVYNEKIRILIHDVQRHVLGNEGRFAWFGLANPDLITRLYRVAGFYHIAIDLHKAITNELLYLAA